MSGTKPSTQKLGEHILCNVSKFQRYERDNLFGEKKPLQQHFDETNIGKIKTLITDQTDSTISSSIKHWHCKQIINWMITLMFQWPG